MTEAEALDVLRRARTRARWSSALGGLVGAGFLAGWLWFGDLPAAQTPAGTLARWSLYLVGLMLFTEVFRMRRFPAAADLQPARLVARSRSRIGVRDSRGRRWSWQVRGARRLPELGSPVWVDTELALDRRVSLIMPTDAKPLVLEPVTRAELEADPTFAAGSGRPGEPAPDEVRDAVVEVARAAARPRAWLLVGALAVGAMVLVGGGATRGTDGLDAASVVCVLLLVAAAPATVPWLLAARGLARAATRGPTRGPGLVRVRVVDAPSLLRECDGPPAPANRVLVWAADGLWAWPVYTGFPWGATHVWAPAGARTGRLVPLVATGGPAGAGRVVVPWLPARPADDVEAAEAAAAARELAGRPTSRRTSPG